MPPPPLPPTTSLPLSRLIPYRQHIQSKSKWEEKKLFSLDIIGDLPGYVDTGLQHKTFILL